MIDKNVPKKTRIEEIYNENLFVEPQAKIRGFGWVQSLQNRSRVISNEAVNLIRKDVIKTKSFQIKPKIEDLDQDNRQIKIALNFVQVLNRDLKEEQAQLESMLDFLKTKIQNLQAHQIKRSHLERNLKSDMYDYGITENDETSGHLNKNLQLQIHLTNTEIRKLETILENSKSSEDFYNLIELIAVRSAYTDDYERLLSIKNNLLNAQEIVVQGKMTKKQGKTKLSKMKIKHLEDNIQAMETEILKSEKMITDMNRRTKLLITEEEGILNGANHLHEEIRQLDSELALLRSKLKE
jgi:hypothetical protein